MCFRVVSTFDRCGHQDTIAHVQYCKNALETSPSIMCALGQGEMTSPVYNIPSFCPSCALLHTVVTVNGHLQEGPNTINITYQVPTPAQAKKIADVTITKQSNDKPLEWKERGSATGGWNESAAPAGDWGASTASAGGDGWNESTEGGFAAQDSPDSFKNSFATTSNNFAASVEEAEDWADASAREEDRRRSNSFAEEPAMIW